MKILFLALFYILTVNFPCLAVAETHKVFTMNVHCFQDQWEFRFKHILDYVKNENPDVISFQEVCTEPSAHQSQIEFIRNYLLKSGYQIETLESQYTHRAWDKFDEYILVISKHRSSQVIKGSLPPSLMQRGYIGINVLDKWFINTHLEYRSDNAHYRRNQIEFLRDRFKDTPHIIMGDFNSSPETSEQNPFWNAGYKPIFPGPTILDKNENGQDKIDGFWLSPEAQGQAPSYEGKIVLNQFVENKHLSDHFAVLLSINFKFRAE